MLTNFKKLPLIHKKVVILSIISLTIALGYFLYRMMRANNPPKEDIKIVEVYPVTRRDIQETTRFIGTIRAKQATLLIAKSKGILDQIVQSGEHLKKGDAIAKIENKDIEQNYKLSQEMEQLAKAQYDRFNQLRKTGVMSKSALEEKESTWIEYQQKLSDAKIAQDEINITAPFDGIVGIFKVRDGSQVQIGDPLVSFYDPSSMIVEFDVPLSLVQFVHTGTSVYVNQQQYPLTYVQQMLDEDTHMLPAYVNIACQQCIVGSAVDVDVVLREKKSVLVIPYETIFLREGKTVLYLFEKGKATLKNVKLGIREKELVEIIDGLQPNDQVILNGQARLYPGSLVQIAPKKTNDAPAHTPSQKQ